MLKRIVLLVILSVMSLAPATARADGESAPAGTPAFKQELIPAEPLSNQHLLESVWVLIIFGLMVVVLYPTAWKQVLAGLKSREEHIRKNIADAETARINAEKSLANYKRATGRRRAEGSRPVDAGGERCGEDCHHDPHEGAAGS